MKFLSGLWAFITGLLVLGLLIFVISVPFLFIIAVGKFLLAYLGAGTIALIVGISVLILLIAMAGSD